MDHKNNTDKMLLDRHRGSFWAQGRVMGRQRMLTLATMSVLMDAHSPNNATCNLPEKWINLQTYVNWRS